MAAYKGSIELISGITPKNDGKFPLVNATDVQVDDTGKRLDEKMQEIEQKIENGGGVADEPISDEEILGLFEK